MKLTRNNFNPRSHEGSDYSFCCFFGHEVISIHAPTRGATVKNQQPTTAIEISIHAPTRGATVFSDIHIFDRYYFNPRSHEGSDGLLMEVCYVILYFNPRSHEGSDLCCRLLCECRTDFNPRSHEGSDPVDSDGKFVYRDFNPRSHEGSDKRALTSSHIGKISIHAPTRGATAIFAKKFSFLSAKIV